MEKVDRRACIARKEGVIRTLRAEGRARKETNRVR